MSSPVTNILPLTYLGNTQYFKKLCFEPCIIDLHENYIKQSYRNRCDILSANGAISLTVNVIKPLTRKCAVRDMRIDYSKRWQHQHWLSILSAYRSSPYFDHFEEHFAPFYTRRYDFLADYNLELTELILRLIRSDAKINLSDKYIDPGDEYNDLRGVFSPKYRPVNGEATFTAHPYYQVFSEKMAFTPNLSVIDLLFCEGLCSIDTLQK